MLLVTEGEEPGALTTAAAAVGCSWGIREFDKMKSKSRSSFNSSVSRLDIVPLLPFVVFSSSEEKSKCRPVSTGGIRLR